MQGGATSIITDRGVVLMSYVTYSDLFTFVMMIIALLALIKGIKRK